MSHKILLVDDEAAIRFAYGKCLSNSGYTVREAESVAEARKIILEERFDAILLDLKLPDGSGIDLIAEARENYPALAIVVITGYSDINLAVDAMRRGADNFLVKPVNMVELELFLRKSLEVGNLRINELARNRVKAQEPYFGESPAMKKAEELIKLAAGTDSTVILLGETGTGKGVMARWIHDHGTRKNMPYVELNCSGLRGDMLASELFGHVKGAFTSAVNTHQGLIELADGGTLFLDEIGDMDIGVQAQFLKVIEEKQYRRLGDVKLRRSEFRLICATNADLEKWVEQGRFRKDLYFRIFVLPVLIPPLRELLDDLPGLISHIMKQIGRNPVDLSGDVINFLKSYHWPGNIRELKNVLERVSLFFSGKAPAVEDFSWINVTENDFYRKEHVTSKTNLQELEREQIKETLSQCNGDVKKAAEMLDISRATLYRKLKK